MECFKADFLLLFTQKRQNFDLVVRLGTRHQIQVS